jgi:amino acid transporter
MASAVAAEYGSGVNTLLGSALGAHPGITYLLPLAVVIAGILLLPSVFLYARFAKIISTAGSAYVWMTTTLGPLTGFVIGFVYFVGVLGSMGFLAYIFSTFISTLSSDLGASEFASWCLTRGGKFLIGLLLITFTLLIHLRGAKQYGRLISILFFGVILAAGATVYYGLVTSPETVVANVSSVLNATVAPPASDRPSATDFFAVVTLFVYLYGGISAAPSVGGESKEAGKTLAAGLIRGWLVALVLYTAVAVSLFHAVPWWVVKPVVDAGKSSLVTIPGLVGIMAPIGVSLAYKTLIVVIAGKTVAPLMFDCSRNLYAWAVDGHVPAIFSHTNSRQAPHVALIAVAVLTVVFLAESVYGGFQIGVALRAISLMLVTVMVGIGGLRIAYSQSFDGSDLKRRLLDRPGLVPTAALAIVIGTGLIYFGLFLPHTPLLLQPGVQGFIAAIIAACIYALSRVRAREAR